MFEKRQKVELPAIMQGDMRKLLDEYGLTEQFNNGQIKCPETGKVITWESLGAIKVENQTIKLYSIHADSIYTPEV